MGKKRDYTGKTYGLLTVICLDEKASLISKRRTWKLACKCGGSISKSSSDLSKLVESSSCGCMPKVGKVRELTHGEKFGELTVVERLGSNSDGKSLWICSCSCGTVTIKQLRSLTNGVHPSCGCYKNVKHGMCDTEVYSSWSAMMSRCYNHNNDYFSYYGGRGISVSSDWHDFRVFYSDMGNRPEGYVLDRVDSNGPYCKENCRWVTRSESSYNTRLQSNNTSGKTGVTWSEKEQRWLARIDFKGVNYNLGSFTTIEGAKRARENAELQYFGYTKP